MCKFTYLTFYYQKILIQILEFVIIKISLESNKHRKNSFFLIFNLFSELNNLQTREDK